MKNMLIVIVGPTAVGKTAVSVELAKRLHCPIINADSRQVYKELSIGTAKPSKEEMAGVKHYFVHDWSITEDWSAGQFEREALSVLEEIYSGENLCIMSGGSGLYIDAVCFGLNSFPEVDATIREGLMARLASDGVASLYSELESYDPEYARQTEPQNSQRVVRALEIYHSSGQKYSDLRIGMNSVRDFDIVFMGLERDREELYKRINARMDVMIAQGLFEEAEDLLDYRDKNALQTVGYNEVYLYLDGKIDKQEAIRILKRNSRRYAKRQMTWFKRNPETEWFHPDQVDKMESFIESKLHT